MTRVLHITRDLAPRINGGISVMVRAVLDADPCLDHTFSVVSFDGWRPRRAGLAGPVPEPKIENGARVLRLSHPDHLPIARAFAEAARPEVVAVHHALLWPFGDEVARHAGARTVYWVHVLQAELDKIRGTTTATRSAQAEKTAFQQADEVRCLSRWSADWLRGRGVTNVDVDGSRDRRLTTPLAADGQTRTCSALYAGRFDVAKGTDTWFAAVPNVAEHVPHARFLIAGGMPDSAKIERRWQRRWTPQWADVGDRVSWLGWLDRGELRRQMAQAGVVVVPSRVETFGLVAAEAMAAGAPIVAADCPGLCELLSGYAGATLVPMGDVDALAGAVINVLYGAR